MSPRAAPERLPGRRPLDRDRRGVLHQAARRRRRRRRQGRVAGRRPAPALVGVGRRRSRPTTTARSSSSSSSSKQQRGRRSRTTPTTARRCTRCWTGPTSVVWSTGSRLAEHPVAARPRRSAGATPHLTVTADHALRAGRARGATAPRPSSPCRPGPGGIVGLGRGSPDRPPVFVGGQIGEWLTGAYAAIGTLASRAPPRRPGRARRRVDARDARRCASPTTR